MPASKEQIIYCLHQTVRTLADTIGFRNVPTAGHQHNVSQLARTIGQVMGLDSDVIDGLRIGATLHDFGMVRVPPGILNKPATLTTEEWELMKQYPVHGYQLLKGIEFPWPVGKMILQHHERLDGSGYPGGIGGEDIILEARIIAVADIVDSMVSDRPWRKGLPVEAALDEIRAHRGTKYDPAVVDACIDIHKNRRQLLDPGNYGR